MVPLLSNDGVNLTTCFYTFNDVILSTNNDSDKALTIAAYDLSYKYSFPNESVDGLWGTIWNATSYSSITRVDENPPFSINDTFNAVTKDGGFNTTLYYNGKGGILEFAALQINLTKMDHEDLVPPTRCWTCKLNWCEKTFEEIRVVNNQLTSTVSEKPLWGFGDYNVDKDLYSKYGVLLEDINFQANASNSVRARYHYGNQEFEWLLDVFHSYYLFELDIGNVSLPSSEGENLADNAGMLASMVYAEDLNITINRIAESFSEFIRTNPDSGGSSGKARGDAQVLSSFIEVRWEWLVLPIAVLIMTSVLLVIVAIRSHNTGVSVWKDDPLALLFHRVAGLEVDPGDKSITRPEDLANLTNGMYVKLSSDGAFTFIKYAGEVKQK